MRMTIHREVVPPIERARRCAEEGKPLIFEGISVDEPSCVDRISLFKVSLPSGRTGFEGKQITRCVPRERFGLTLFESIRTLDREMVEPFLRETLKALRPEDVEKGLKEASCP